MTSLQLLVALEEHIEKYGDTNVIIIAEGCYGDVRSTDSDSDDFSIIN